MPQTGPFNAEQALLGDWRSVDFLFQLTGVEVQDALHIASHGGLLFESKGKYDGAVIESYLFLAIDLCAPEDRAGERAGRTYTRTELSAITRAVNRLFDMPVMVLFRHADTLTLAIIRRRLSKRDESRDVLDKVTLVKDIRFADPLRAHIEILNDLSLAALHEEVSLHNFVGLHAAWERRLDSYALNERFYREVTDWYFWALDYKGIVYPRSVRTEDERSMFLIRLLTRLIFCWFLQEKRLIPRDVFRPRYAKAKLKDFGDAAGTYYRAFLQNLFFATLNQESDKRGFRHKNPKGRDAHRGVTNLFRYADLLVDAEEFEKLLRQVPFVNGGLFDCLDEVFEKDERRRNVRLDDFSEEKDINLVNTDPSLWWYKHRKVYPLKDDPYIANGEIGMAIGFFWKKGLPDLRWKLEVEFSSQPSFKYDFTSRDFGEEGNPVLELAYALTVHKSQGSEFGTVLLVLPNPCRLLSREMLYTALTRQKERIVILHEGPRTDLRRYSSNDRSEIARRLTNLFTAPSPIHIDRRFYEEHLIHRTARGEMVRSKSEVIIADHLASKGVEYGYEQPLTIDGVTKYPDFTIEDAEAGEVYYWEHCGMLHVPTYRRRWEEKLAWYKVHDIVPYEEGGGPKGILIVTRDEPNGSIDSERITRLIADLLRT